MHIKKMLILTTLLLSTTSTMASPKTDNKDNLKFQQCYEDAITTIDLRECISKEYTHYDLILNLRYKLLMKMLPKIGKERLSSAEKAWITFKNKECDFSAYQAYGGTLAPVIEGHCHVDITKKRINSINEYIEGYKPH